MQWLLTSPCHQQPYYWLPHINGSLSSTGNNFKYLCHLNAEKWCKMQMYISYFYMSMAKITRAWFNIKMTSYQKRKSHHNGITGKMPSLYWLYWISICFLHPYTTWRTLRPGHQHNTYHNLHQKHGMERSTALACCKGNLCVTVDSLHSFRKLCVYFYFNWN